MGGVKYQNPSINIRWAVDGFAASSIVLGHISALPYAHGKGMELATDWLPPSFLFRPAD